MNPLIDNWLKIWDKLTGRYYRYRPDPTWTLLDNETRYVGGIYYGGLAPEAALQILETGQLKPHFYYRHFTQKKRSGGKRHLNEPDEHLKRIQKSLLRSRLNNATIHPAAIGFRHKKSIADHVWAHSGAHLIITADIRDFFPSTTQFRVEQWWRSELASEQAAKFATILTTYRGSLPQGAPTSPALSNAVNFPMDKTLTKHVERSGGRYTRYADDMVFSWQRNFRSPTNFEQSVRSVLREYGYELNDEKGWQVYRRSDEPEITGLVLRKDGTVTIPDAMLRKIEHLQQSVSSNNPQLRGYYGFRKMVEGYTPAQPASQSVSQGRRRFFWQRSSNDSVSF